MEERERLQKKYYINFEPLQNNDNLTNNLLIKRYEEYIDKLKEFIDELNEVKKNLTKENFIPNHRQTGAYKRCVTNYPDKGWNDEYSQYTQAYKELMVDFLYYPEIKYDELSTKETDVLKEMALFLLEQAKINVNKLK